ncbi:dihydroorotase [Tuberibacillus calidus]|uniref:dihydroorotase n=1 Tax=Tuberibacillus calidus TaxID=340097 RepID=UPI00040A65E9|nr:dihydroorotase [Tuberibacillus calidus]
MAILLKNGRVYFNGAITEADLLIDQERIADIGQNLQVENAEVMDLNGKLLVPGFVDLHVHLREPGGEHKETIKTGTEAAARGGFTTIAAMPNTNPVPDDVNTLTDLYKRIEKDAVVRVLPYAAITKGQKGQELTDIESLHQVGAFALTDDGVGVQSAGLMFEAMEKAARSGIAVVAHCEDNTLLSGGSFHEGRFTKKHGIKGMKSLSESVHIARDVLLAEAAGCHYHVCHVSTKESVRVIRDAKRAGIRVTAEVTPHHLLLTEDDIPGIDANYKMNPPLRSQADREALIEGLLDGTIDFIATDHAPHTAEEKARPIDEAPFGIVGLETAFPLLYTHLVKTGVLSLEQLIDCMTKKPCEAFDLPYGPIKIGAPADVTVIDLEKERTIDPEQFASKGRNTPFRNWKVCGFPVMTIVNGKLIWDERGVRV